MKTATRSSSNEHLRRWLLAWSHGDDSAANRFLPLIYDDLRRLAGSMLRCEAPDPLLQPAMVVHETYLRLLRQRHVRWTGRRHFLSVATRIMRRVLLDQARRRQATKRGACLTRVPLRDDLATTCGGPVPQRDAQQNLAEALRCLRQRAPRQARIVELRFFAGLTIQETAQRLQISTGTVKSDWLAAREWLGRWLER